MSDEYKRISKEVTKQISLDDCKVLNFLKRKHDKESKKYHKKYGDKL